MTYFPDVLSISQDDHTDTHDTSTTSFAPRPSGLRAKFKKRLGTPLKIPRPHKGPVAIIQDACSVSHTLNEITFYERAFTDFIFV
jgi:hypothetical protein